MNLFKKIIKNCFRKISVILNAVKDLKFLLEVCILRFFVLLPPKARLASGGRMTPKKGFTPPFQNYFYGLFIFLTNGIYSKNKKNSVTGRAGFTLIELLLVVAIVAFTAAIIFSAVSSTRERARDTKRIGDLNQIEKAIELYRNDYGGDPAGADGQEYINGVPNWIPGLIPSYIRVVPSDPIDRDPFQYHYKRQGNDFELAARMERRDNQAARNDGGPGGSKFYEIGSKNNIISTTGSGPTGGGWGGSGLIVTVISIFPSSGNNSGSASISTIEGTEFAAFGAITVKLARAGYPDIVGTGFNRISSTTITGGSFNLTGVAAGQWDVVVIDNGLTGQPSGSFDGGFNVLSGPDTLAPTNVIITSPASAATIQATININADATDDVGVVKMEFKLDATPTFEVRIFDDTVPAWSAVWDTTTATNGSHTLVVVASDAAGNRATSSPITVTVNNIAPTVTTNPESNLAPTSVTFNGSANPNNLLTTGWFRRWTASQSSCIDSGGTRVPTTGVTSLGALNTPQPYSEPVTGLTASTNYWYCAFASNFVGTGVGTVRPFITPAVADTTPPSTPTGLTATAISSSQIDLFWTASTDNVAVTGYKVYRCTGVGCTPTVLFTTLGVVTTYSNTGLTASTDYGYKVSAIDAAGNESVLSATAYAATLAPSTITFDNVTALTFSAVITATVNHALAAGSNRMLIIATALEASSPAPTITQITVNGGPAVGVLVGAQGTGQALDQRVEMWRVMEANLPVSGTISVAVTFSASVNPGIAVMSFANVAQQAEEAEAGSSILSNTTISTNITTLTNGALIVSNVGNGQGAGTYTAAASQTERWDTAPSSAAHSGSTEIKATAGLDIQSHTYSVSANRHAQYVAAFAPAVADTTFPTVSISAPANGATVSGTAQTVSATASDNVGVAGVQFKLDGANLQAEDITSPYSITWNTTTATNGAHSLTAVARDAAGNQTTSAAVNVTVSNILSGLMAGYAFSEGSGISTIDSSGNGNTGNLTGGPVWTAGRYGGGLDFNGSTALVGVSASAGSVLDLDVNPVTITAWINTRSVTTQQAILLRGLSNGVAGGTEGYGMFVNSTGAINVGSAGGGNFNSNVSITANTWYHIAVVFNGTVSKVYIDGIDRTPAVVNVNVTASNINLNIGASRNTANTAYTRYFNGFIDEVRVYNRVLTPSEITSVMNTTL